MKKIVILFFIFIFKSFFILGQTSGEITYIGNLNISKLKKMINSGSLDSIPDQKYYMEKFISETKPIIYKLIFYNKESLFRKENGLEADRKKMNLVDILEGNALYYINLSENLLLEQKNAFGERFLIKRNLSFLKWNLTNKTKQIGKYLCFKATAVEKFSTVNGENSKEITAWYCPELPYSFGPSKYCKLPGLILEIEFQKFIFKASKIKISKKKIKIKKPVNGREVNQKEFEEIGMQTMSNLRNR